MKKKTTNNNILSYSMQIAMLGKLLAQGLINSKEYQNIKSDLMRAYSITSDLTI